MISIRLGNVGCLSKGTLVYTKDGLLPIEKCKTVLSLNDKGDVISIRCNVINSGLKKVYEISYGNFVVRASSEHKWFILRNNKICVTRTKHLKEGDLCICCDVYEHKYKTDKVSIPQKENVCFSDSKKIQYESAKNSKSIEENGYQNKTKQLQYASSQPRHNKILLFKQKILNEKNRKNDEYGMCDDKKTFALNEHHSHKKKLLSKSANIGQIIEKTIFEKTIKSATNIENRWYECEQYTPTINQKRTQTEKPYRCCHTLESKEYPKTEKLLSNELSIRFESKPKEVFTNSKNKICMDMYALWAIFISQNGFGSTSYQQKRLGQPCDKSYGSLSAMSCPITSIRKIQTSEIMYDLQVPIYNSFILSNGVLSHNSGKTACAVRELFLNQSMRDTYTNIRTKIPTCHMINHEMIIKKEQTGVRKNGEAIYDFKLNVDFWKSIGKPINVVLDEAHTMFNARKSMSKVNIIMTDWLALIRRVLGQAESGYGELVLISQLANRIDCIAREMATNVRWHVCNYSKTCLKCGYTWQENSDTPEPIWACESCGHFKIKKHSHYIEVWHFASMQAYEMYKGFGMSTYHMHYIVSDIEDYFSVYDTLSWESLTSTLYD